MSHVLVPLVIETCACTPSYAICYHIVRQHRPTNCSVGVGIMPKRSWRSTDTSTQDTSVLKHFGPTIFRYQCRTVRKTLQHWCVNCLTNTRSSANAEKPCEHTVSWNRVKCCKCSTDCIWKSMQPLNDLQGHSRSLMLLPFDRPYTISY